MRWLPPLCTSSCFYYLSYRSVDRSTARTRSCLSTTKCAWVLLLLHKRNKKKQKRMIRYRIPHIYESWYRTSQSKCHRLNRLRCHYWYKYLVQCKTLGIQNALLLIYLWTGLLRRHTSDLTKTRNLNLWTQIRHQGPHVHWTGPCNIWHFKILDQTEPGIRL